MSDRDFEAIGVHAASIERLLTNADTIDMKVEVALDGFNARDRAESIASLVAAAMGTTYSVSGRRYLVGGFVISWDGEAA